MKNTYGVGRFRGQGRWKDSYSSTFSGFVAVILGTCSQVKPLLPKFYDGGNNNAYLYSYAMYLKAVQVKRHQRKTVCKKGHKFVRYSKKQTSNPRTYDENI